MPSCLRSLLIAPFLSCLVCDITVLARIFRKIRVKIVISQARQDKKGPINYFPVRSQNSALRKAPARSIRMKDLPGHRVSRFLSGVQAPGRCSCWPLPLHKSGLRSGLSVCPKKRPRKRSRRAKTCPTNPKRSPGRDFAVPPKFVRLSKICALSAGQSGAFVVGLILGNVVLLLFGEVFFKEIARNGRPGRQEAPGAPVLIKLIE